MAGAFDDLIGNSSVSNSSANPLSGNFDDLLSTKKIEPHESILLKAIHAGRPGGMSSLLGIPEQDLNNQVQENQANIFPFAGQLAGGMTGGFPGAVAGEGAGEVARQGVKMLQGRKATPMDIPVGMGITAIGEGVPRLAFNSYFGRQIATKTMNKLGEAIGSVKSALASDPTAEISSGPIVQKLNSIYNGIKKPLQGQASHLKDWIDHLSSNPTIHATDLQQMEDSFGAYSKYGSYENGTYQPPKSTEPVINKATKAARDVVSNSHDELAVSKGFKEFPEQSKEYSGYKSRWKDINPAKDTASKWLGQFGKAGLGYMVGREAGAGAGIGTYLAENVLTNPMFKGMAYNVINNPITNTALSAGRLAGTELTRDVSR